MFTNEQLLQLMEHYTLAELERELPAKQFLFIEVWVAKHLKEARDKHQKKVAKLKAEHPTFTYFLLNEVAAGRLSVGQAYVKLAAAKSYSTSELKRLSLLPVNELSEEEFAVVSEWQEEAEMAIEEIILEHPMFDFTDAELVYFHNMPVADIYKAISEREEYDEKTDITYSEEELIALAFTPGTLLTPEQDVVVTRWVKAKQREVAALMAAHPSLVRALAFDVVLKRRTLEEALKLVNDK